jgi:mannose-6-phosphate isomerase-like protein (cupin superfamily)
LAPTLGDLDQLRQYYIDHGYLDIDIPANAVEITPGNGQLTYVVHLREGRQYKVGAISVSGNTQIATDALIKEGVLQSGSVFSPLTETREADRLRQLFRAAGYPQTMVQAVRKANPQTGLVDVDFKISETAPAATPARNAAVLIPSSVIDISKLRVQPNAVGSRRDVFNGPTTTLDNFESHITTVNVGQSSHMPHTHGNEELLVVKEGTMEVTINGKTQIAPAGSIIFYAANDLHGLRNGGDVPATYFVFNWRTAKTPATIPAAVTPAAPPPPASGTP